MKPNFDIDLDFARINLEEFFGCVNNTNYPEWMCNTFKTVRTWRQEKSFEANSDGQLTYVGDYMHGVDFLSINKVRYEMKGLRTMFQKKNGGTYPIDFKSFRGENKEIKKTFDYMFLVDTTTMSMAVTDWNTVEKRLPKNVSESPTAKLQFIKGDFMMLAQNVKPAPRDYVAPEEMFQNAF